MKRHLTIDIEVKTPDAKTGEVQTKTVQIIEPKPIKDGRKLSRAFTSSGIGELSSVPKLGMTRALSFPAPIEEDDELMNLN